MCKDILSKNYELYLSYSKTIGVSQDKYHDLLISILSRDNIDIKDLNKYVYKALKYIKFNNKKIHFNNIDINNIDIPDEETEDYNFDNLDNNEKLLIEAYLKNDNIRDAAKSASMSKSTYHRKLRNIKL